MGYAANGWCFDTPDAAAAFSCGHMFPVVVSMVDGSGNPATVITECTGSSGNVLTLQRSVNGVVSGTSTIALTAPACDVLEWHTFYPFSWSASDGAVVAGAVLSCWLVGWGWKAVFSVLRGRFASSSGGDEE